MVLIEKAINSGQMASRTRAWGRYLVGQIIGYENMGRWNILVKLVKLKELVIRRAKLLRVSPVGVGKSPAVRQVREQ